MSLQRGRQLGPYQIVEQIGAGGMGEVYRARDERLGRDVAVKVLPDDVSDNQQAMARFQQEAKVVAALSHPNILAIHDVGDEEGLTYLITELLEGETLQERLARGPLAETELLDTALAIAQGLTAAHERGVIHRDLKPGNIFLTENQNVKLLDFGLARISGTATTDTASYAAGTAPGTIMGSAHYMSPEQVRGETVDYRSDLFSFGLVLFEMVAAVRAFDRTSAVETMAAILNESPPELDASCPAGVRQIVRRCLEKAPADRFQHSSELAAAFKELQSGSHRPVPQVPVRSVRGRRTAALMMGVGVVIVAGLLVSRWLDGPPSAAPGAKSNAAAANTSETPRVAPVQDEKLERVRWAHQEAVPRIVRHIEAGEFSAAMALATAAREWIPEDPTLNELWSQFSDEVTVQTEPSGAEVFVRDYDSQPENWELLGTSPIDKARLSRGMKRWRLTKAGHATIEYALPHKMRRGEPHQFLLPVQELVPDDMMLVPAGQPAGRLIGMALFAERPELNAFLIDRYEVTNAQFKVFVDAGGYQNLAYWKHAFVEGGQEISWTEAQKRFVDSIGRAGPRGWELGEYPEGQARFPVAGVSWYEAAAYAEFVNKRLPTVYHWLHAAGLFSASAVVPLSNIEGAAVAAVGSFTGMSGYGAYDMAGNVSEWCFNGAGQSRFNLGGNVSDKSYFYTFPKTRPPFERDAGTGFRCMRLLDDEQLPAQVIGPVEVVTRDYSQEKPCSDADFQQYLQRFEYDREELNAKVEASLEEQDWVREKVTVDAAYDDDRLVLYLYLPKRGQAPFHTVVMYPGSGAINPAFKDRFGPPSYLLKSGRAVLLPIYKSTYERQDELDSTWPDKSHRYASYLIKWVKDFRRAVDYVETRSDLDSERLAYFGFSWGGRMGAIIPAVETRIKTAVLYVGGLASAYARPEVDQINFVSRVKVPVLMLNGRYDSIEPLELAQLPMYQLLGTLPEHKRHVVYETGHSVPRNEGIKESLDWLDKYLGPVDGGGADGS